MESEFENLMLDFRTIMQAVAGADDLATRRTVLTEAHIVLSKARIVWQEEMKKLRYGVECLREARGETIRLAAEHRNSWTLSRRESAAGDARLRPLS